MKVPLFLRVYQILFLVLLTALLGYLAFGTELSGYFSNSDNDKMTALSSDWTGPDGQKVVLDDIVAAKLENAVFYRELPQNIKFNDELCMITENSDIRVYVDNKLSYEFRASENLTGMGYGNAYHTVNLSPEDSGKTIKIEMESVFDNGKGGRVGEIYLAAGMDYRNYIMRGRTIPFLLSFFIMIAGILLIILRYGVPQNQPLPFNLVALGYALTLIGIWFIGDTGVLQIITGHYGLWRAIDFFMLFFAIIPLLAFVVSLTKYKRRIFVHITFLLPFLVIAILLSYRFIFGIDMTNLTKFIYFSYAVLLLIMGLIIVDNEVYCRKNKSKSGLLLFYIGAGAFTVGIITDLILYAGKGKPVVRERGNFTRIGVIVLIVTMLIKVIQWWAKEQTSFARERFINKILQYSMSSVDSDTKINLVLEYLGSEFSADRAYIFEDMGENLFDNTYEWCNKGVTAQIDNLKGLPYKGVIDVWYEEYKKNDVVLIYDLEDYRQISESMYNILQPQGIRTLVTAPLETNGKYIGFFGLDNPPADMMDEIKEVLQLLSYFFSQLVIEERYEKKLLHYSYYDSLTGVRNRRAIKEFEQTEFDPSDHFGFIMCDINGLKATNDNQGHEAGDVLLKDISGILSNAFGNDNVYRMGGDEFAVYDCESDEKTFNERVDAARKAIGEAGHSISLGSVYCRDGSDNYEDIKSQADSLMYVEKRKYYEGRNDRRH